MIAKNFPKTVPKISYDKHLLTDFSGPMRGWRKSVNNREGNFEEAFSELSSMSWNYKITVY
jgi:hypothetical protein